MTSRTVVADHELARRLADLADIVPAVIVRALAALGIADHLTDTPRPSADIARDAAVDASALRRLLRAATAHGIVAGGADDTYGATALVAALRTDHPYSMRDAYGLSRIEIDVLAHLAISLRTGQAAFAHVYGHSHRLHRATHPEEDARMDRAHRAASRVEVLTLSRLYDWRTAATVVDVGGGTGAFLVGLLRRFKHLRGVLFDLPQMLSNAGEVLDGAGVAARCELVAGDFFEAVPASADVYLLKAVIGGWDDDASVRILSTIRSAMRDDSELLVIEPILGYGDGFGPGNVVHLLSLALYGGPDRDREDYDRVLRAAGLQVAEVVERPTMSMLVTRPITGRRGQP